MNHALNWAIESYIKIGNGFHQRLRDKGHTLLTVEVAREERVLISGVAEATRKHAIYQHLDLFADDEFADTEAVIASMHVGMARSTASMKVQVFFATIILQLDMHLQREVPVGSVIH